MSTEKTEIWITGKVKNSGRSIKREWHGEEKDKNAGQEVIDGKDVKIERTETEKGNKLEGNETENCQFLSISSYLNVNVTLSLQHSIQSLHRFW